MLETTNYQFKKPELADSPPDITAINPNWDKVDQMFKAKVGLNDIDGSILGTANFNTFITVGRFSGAGYYSNMSNLPSELTGAVAALFSLTITKLGDTTYEQKLTAAEGNVSRQFFRTFVNNSGTISWGIWKKYLDTPTDFFPKEKDSTADLNTLWTTGMYKGIFTNYPPACLDGQGNAIVFGYNSGANAGWTRQLFITAHEAHVYVRNCGNGTWGSWEKIWSGTNDGAGSGLDADLLDGFQGINFMKCFEGYHTDCDLLSESGTYNIYDTAINTPFTGSGVWGTLLVISGRAATDRVIQIYNAWNGGERYFIRRKNNGTWAAWAEMLTLNIGVPVSIQSTAPNFTGNLWAY